MIIRTFTSICIGFAVLFSFAGFPARANNLDGLVFKDSSGNDVSLHDFKGKAVLLNFWATWCGPCIMEMPGLVALQRQYKDKGLVVIPVSEDDSPNDALQYFQQNQITSPRVYYDKGHKAMREIRGRGLPTSLLIDSTGKEVKAIEGPIETSAPEFKKLIEQLLPVQQAPNAI
jgi:thiol-disulfide isomerase/thioredoxin